MARKAEPAKPDKDPNKIKRLAKKEVKIAVLKTMTNADDEITTISRPLTCEECSRHKQVVGIMPRKDHFNPTGKHDATG